MDFDDSGRDPVSVCEEDMRVIEHQHSFRGTTFPRTLRAQISMWCHRSIGAGHDQIAIAFRGIRAGSLACHRLSLPEQMRSEIAEPTLFWTTGTSGGPTALLGPLDHHHRGPPENQRSHHRQGSKDNVRFTPCHASCSRATPTNQAQY